MDVNVYEDISTGDYICSGDMLYDHEEMREMLSSSGLSSSQKLAIYELNRDKAMGEIYQKIGNFGELGDIPHSNITEGSPEDLYSYARAAEIKDSLRSYINTDVLFFGLVISQAALVIALISIMSVLDAPGWCIWGVAIMMVASYISAVIVMRVKEASTEMELQVLMDQINLLRGKSMADVARRRERMMRQIQNTVLMYDTIAEDLAKEDNS